MGKGLGKRSEETWPTNSGSCLVSPLLNKKHPGPSPSFRFCLARTARPAAAAWRCCGPRNLLRSGSGAPALSGGFVFRKPDGGIERLGRAMGCAGFSWGHAGGGGEARTWWKEEAGCWNLEHVECVEREKLFWGLIPFILHCSFQAAAVCLAIF